jgi:NarL family two-component system response regulator LiaR
MAFIDEFLRALPPPPARFLDGLSPRELEVLRLLASGKSNQQIAQELVISLSTVLHHVTSILTKTSTSNRTEAAAYAIRHGLD